MKKDICIIIGNVRDGEVEGLLEHKVEVCLIKDRMPSNKRCADPRIHVIAEVNFDDSHAEMEVGAIINAYQCQSANISILNYREKYVRLTAAVCQKFPEMEHYYLHTNTVLDKQMQRQCFNAAENDALHVCSKALSLTQLQQDPDRVHFPCIIKPANLYSSLYVKSLRNSSDLQHYLLKYAPSINALLAQQPTANDGFLVEEYLIGSNHSLDCLVDETGNVTALPIVDVVTGNDIGAQDFHHFARFAPTLLTMDRQAQAQQMAYSAVASLQLQSCLVHVEFVNTPQGPKIIELNPRPGGNRIHMLREVYGLDVDYAFHCLLSSQPLQAELRQAVPFALVTPFAKQEMVFQGVDTTFIEQLLSFHRCYSYTEVGDRIGPVDAGYQNYFYIELKANNVQQLRQDVMSIAQHQPFYQELA